VRGMLGIREREGDLVIAFLLHYVEGQLRPDGQEVTDARFVSLEELEELTPVMGLSREIARTALRWPHAAVPRHRYRPAGAKGYVLYLADAGQA